VATMRNVGGGADWGWDGLRNVAGKVVRNVAPVRFRGLGRLSRRNDVAYPPAAFRLHPALPAIPRRPSPERPRLASREHAAAHPQRDRLVGEATTVEYKPICGRNDTENRDVAEAKAASSA
jgi:hypothetical protein